MYRFLALLSTAMFATALPALAATPEDAAITDGLQMRPTISDHATSSDPSDDQNDELAMTLAPLSSAAALVSPLTRHAVGPKLQVRVDLSDQRMTVLVAGKLRYTWPVSTARPGYKTPTGFWSPYRMHVMWHSRKYDNAPMPHSVFFHEGYAVHATPHVKRLGRPASHGCIRLHPDHAEDFFELVKAFGPQNTRIVIVQ